MSKPLATATFSASVAALAVFALSMFDAGSQAKPTQAQISAIRAACRADYRAHCAAVPPGGAPALACLKKNVASLSGACQSAVKAAAGGSPNGSAASKPTAKPAASATSDADAARASASAPAATGGKPTQAQISAIRSACREDYTAHCADVPPGGSAALACLKKNTDSLSAACQSAVSAVGGASGSSATPNAEPEGAPPESAPAASSPEPGAETPPEERTRSYRRASPRQGLAIIRQFCGRDYRVLCGGVAPGGGRIVGCLQDNASALSPGCKRALGQMLQR